MLDELVARVPAPEELLALTPSQLDGVLLTCIAGRANSTDPIAAKYVYEDEIVGLYPVGVKATYQQRIAIDIALIGGVGRGCCRADLSCRRLAKRPG